MTITACVVVVDYMRWRAEKKRLSRERDADRLRACTSPAELARVRAKLARANDWLRALDLSTFRIVAIGRKPLGNSHRDTLHGDATTPPSGTLGGAAGDRRTAAEEIG